MPPGLPDYHIGKCQVAIKERPRQLHKYDTSVVTHWNRPRRESSGHVEGGRNTISKEMSRYRTWYDQLARAC